VDWYSISHANWLLLVTLASLLGALVASLVLLARSSEMRVGLLAAALALLAVHPAFSLWRDPERPVGFDPATGADVAFLLAGLLSLFVVAALWRTLGERDRIETLHWDAMEGLRALGELGTARPANGDALLARLLEIGCTCFGVELGIVSRVANNRYEVLAIRAPESFPVAKGAAFPLEETCCASALASAKPVAWAGGKTSEPPPNGFRLRAYLGSSVTTSQGVYGTLCFGSFAPRRSPFTATDKDLVRVMAQWLGGELEWRERPATAAAPAPQLARKAARRAVPERPNAVPRRRVGAARRSVDLNEVLARVHRKLARTAGPEVELELRAAPDLKPALDHHLPLDAIVGSLVRNALDAMPEGGKLTLATANLEVAAGEPGVVPSRQPDRYVTLSVRDTGSSPDVGALARAFEPAAAASAVVDEGRLPLATVYRLLQRCGGDLSVSVEPGRGTDFTLFLPLAEAAAARERARAPDEAPSAGDAPTSGAAGATP
jgi:hypothetical protein